MPLRCITIDDESLARKMMEENIRQVPFLEFVGAAKNAFEAMTLLQEYEVDLMFLDIQMPGMLGTQLLQSLRTKPLVIFVTAYANYALEGYELEVVDYLMKPVSMERFTKAALKAQEIFAGRNALAPKTESPQQQIHSQSEPDRPDHFFVNVEYSLVKILIHKVRYVEGMKDYVKIYLEGERKPILTKATLKSIEEKLGEERFMRIHKSYIADLDRVTSIRGQQITLGEAELPVSESSVAEVLKRIGVNR